MATSELTFLKVLESTKKGLTKEQLKGYNIALNVIYGLADESCHPEELTIALDSYFEMNPRSKLKKKLI